MRSPQEGKELTHWREASEGCPLTGGGAILRHDSGWKGGHSAGRSTDSVVGR